jgi:hypothetical protein
VTILITVYVTSIDTRRAPAPARGGETPAIDACYQGNTAITEVTKVTQVTKVTGVTHA